LSGLILPIDKPAGWTSFDVVAKLRGGLKWKKVGHAGTLDPMATGLLLVMCGDATALSDEYMGLGKSYRGTIRLGVTTDSDDLDGRVITESPVNWDGARIAKYLEGLRGEILQKPPAVSAIKVDGKRSYKQVLRGKDVELAARPVQIYAIRIIELRNPDVTFEIDCGKGTYVRSVARDLGEHLGSGGALSALRRLGIGPYTVEHAWTIAGALKQPEFRGE